ncbi:hypothetical protein FACS189434_12820 [Bacteroidia bacterium]|nr:hypothetical protein FACS189434_12820 [Bacteroidia bacterium]
MTTAITLTNDIKVSEKPLYNPEFVQKIKSQEGTDIVWRKINIEDLWK